MTGAREQLIGLYRAATAGADVESLTAHAVASVPLERRHRVWVFAFGKAAHGMARGAVSSLQRSLADIPGGIVVAPDDGPAPYGSVTVMTGDHPVPGARSFAAATALHQVVTLKRGTDLGVVLLSGGASSLIGAPLRGLTEADLTRVCQLLLNSGLDIAAMNAVRKRFCLWAAGRMALALAPARSYCFAVSDVPGDDLATIGSGPCVPDPTRVQEVIDILQNGGLLGKLPATFHQYLTDTARGGIPETPKETHPAFAHMTARVIANNSIALGAAATAARAAGLSVEVRTEPLAGDARTAGVRLADVLLSARERAPIGTPLCVMWGGETTVALGANPPAGGRCQALALAAAKQLAEAGDRARGISLLAAGTDGRDGTTDAAGAIVDRDTWPAIRDTGINPSAALEAHDSHFALSAVNALFAPGLTGTNVMDVVIGLVGTGH
ncbi:MAG: DUF4147 domain-containing protein [Gemmatimonadaceae bacterium]